MNHRNLLIALLTAACAASLGGVFVQARQLSTLRAEQQRRLALLAPASGNPEAPASAESTAGLSAAASSSVPPELLRLRNKVSRLTGRKRELSGALSENESLRAQLARRATNSPAGTGLPAGYIRKNQAKMAGYNTPEDTIQSFLWALNNRDFPNLLQGLTPESAQKLQEPERMDEFFRASQALVGINIIGRQQLVDGIIELKVEMIPGLPPETIRFRQIGGQWKMEMH